MVLNRKRIHNPFDEISPKELNDYFKSFICRQENATAVRSLRTKIIIIGNSKQAKNHHFCDQLSHCSSIY